MAKERRIIMLVDDNTTNLTTGKNILGSYYNVFPIPSGAQLFEILARVKPDLILLDIIMPGMDGYEVIKKLKADPKTVDIPVIFLTARSDTGSELDGLSLGAIDYIAKPFSPPLLLKRIENHLLISSQRTELRAFNRDLQGKVNEQTTQILELQYAVINAIAGMVEFRDDITGRHISRTQQYLNLLVNKLIESGLYKEETEKWDLNFLVPSAQLHDVGKIGIRDSILNKPGRFTDEEYDDMKNHTIYGVQAIEEIAKTTREHKFLAYAKNFAGTHHEKWDGTGYPEGLKGLEIPLEGRLMAIADVYDALISERPYKDPMTFKEAEQVIIEGSGTQFDPALIEIFKPLAENFAGIAQEYL
ncbi:response regulator [Spirochaetia bacterium]|nr:response regulator [Spirochaetia bacterium]